jgi:hypothetical protein
VEASGARVNKYGHKQDNIQLYIRFKFTAYWVRLMRRLETNEIINLCVSLLLNPLDEQLE